MHKKSFSVPLFLLKVREGQPLERSEIQSFIQNMHTIPDSQLSAFLVHAYHKPLSVENMVDLTLAMRDSGECFDWQDFEKPVVDKHSTGGVGDKVTLCLGPLLAAMDLAIPTIAGRGLGHTGGTTDKFESIPGFSCDLSSQQIQEQVRRLGIAIGKQSDSVAPADRKFYALRDITATVPSIPLITASILSKKLTENLDALVIDLKWGNGAFMATLESARNLAKSLIETAEKAGTKTKALITNMNQPLGSVSGNFSEMVEAVLILKNDVQQKTFSETRELTLKLAAELYHTVYPEVSLEESYQKSLKTLESGKAFEIFCKVLEAQGAQGNFFDKSFDLIPQTQHKIEIRSQAQGYVSNIATKTLGQALVLAKAGRQKEQDVIDASVTLYHPVKLGDFVDNNDLLCSLHFNDQSHVAKIENILNQAFTVSKTQEKPFKLIEEVL